MVRVGGLQYVIDPTASMGNRISGMRLQGRLLDANKLYKVAGWAPVAEEAKQTAGEPIWDLLAHYLTDIKTVKARSLNMPKILGAEHNPGFSV
jgi:sulfur-oxidizing protein SoxB